ncbi:DUF4118 domain-containing protein [Streptomyces sp. NPDC019890]|uniref:DUF4118 domain-containing protein n=1 Tax=Streptomyces sp. NPDC019890 TaxID=3365064 RepID=UPI00384D968B
MRTPLRDTVALGAALLAPPAVAAVLVPFRDDATNATLALILVVVVVAVAAIGNRTAGALAALSAAAWFDFFLTRPYQQFTINDADDIETAVLLLVVGIVVSQLAARARKLQVIAVTDAGQLARLHETAQLVQASGSPDKVVDHVRRQLVDVLELRGCRFEYDSLLGQPPRLEQDGGMVVARKHWDVERRGWPEGEIELRVFGNGHYRGRFMLRPGPGSVPSLQARLVAVTLADQTGAALNTAGPVLEH